MKRHILYIGMWVLCGLQALTAQQKEVSTKNVGSIRQSTQALAGDSTHTYLDRYPYLMAYLHRALPTLHTNRYIKRALFSLERLKPDSVAIKEALRQHNFRLYIQPVPQNNFNFIEHGFCRFSKKFNEIYLDNDFALDLEKQLAKQAELKEEEERPLSLGLLFVISSCVVSEFIYTDKYSYAGTPVMYQVKDRFQMVLRPDEYRFTFDEPSLPFYVFKTFEYVPINLWEDREVKMEDWHWERLGITDRKAEASRLLAQSFDKLGEVIFMQLASEQHYSLEGIYTLLQSLAKDTRYQKHNLYMIFSGSSLSEDRWYEDTPEVTIYFEFENGRVVLYEQLTKEGKKQLVDF